jgi:hypothetical protein
MPGPDSWSLSLVIPAFNEEAGIRQAVAQRETLRQSALDYRKGN